MGGKMALDNKYFTRNVNNMVLAISLCEYVSIDISFISYKTILHLWKIKNHDFGKFFLLVSYYMLYTL